ncbi:MAG TPA: porin [Verrucomicrobiae bacterium]|nr:porin [Verrucomicrobiae bacterium]
MTTYLVVIIGRIQKLDQKVSYLETQHQAAQPATASSDNAQIQDLDQKVRILERQREIDQDAAATVTKTAPKITLGASGLGFSSADSNFVATLHGLIQADSRTFFNDGGGTLGKNTFLLRRARPIFTGTVFHDFDFNFTPDFGGSAVLIYDAYLNYHYNAALQLEAGKFKSPVGLEALQSDTSTPFNERSLATDLVPNRDIGFELHGDLFGGAVSYAAGIFDGAPDYTTPAAPLTTQDADDDKAFAGRLFFQPWKTSGVAALQGFGFGVGGSYEQDGPAATGNLTSGYKTDGQQTLFSYAAGVIANGTHWRISPQGYYYCGPFSLLGEYIVSDQQVSRTTAPLVSKDLQNTAWEISAGWILTGETASYNGITPAHPFNLKDGQWGAWQIVARYADLDIDNAAFAAATPFAAAGSASEAKAWSVGLNWYLNRDIRVNASFSRTTFERGGTAAPTAIVAQPENVFFTRIQLAF